MQFEVVLQVQVLMLELLLFWEPLLLCELILLPGFDKVIMSFFLFLCSSCAHIKNINDIIELHLTEFLKNTP